MRRGRNYKVMDFLKTIWLFVLLEFTSLSSLWCDEKSSDQTDSHSCGNQYSESCNLGTNDLTNEEMFQRGHMKPFGSHRPPDFIVEELPHMISPQDFYMHYVAKHEPVVLKGNDNWHNFLVYFWCMITCYFSDRLHHK